MSQVTSNPTTGLFTFNICDAQGKITNTKQLTFQEAVLQMGMDSLKVQDDMFTKEFQEAQERVSQMTQLNEMTQMFNKYKNCFDKDGKITNPSPGTGSEKVLTLSGEDLKAWQEKYLPTFIRTGLIDDGSSKGTSPMGVGTDGTMTYKELTTFLENTKTYQSTLSSLNEQQMLKTNQAASRRSTILQQLQTLLGSVKEGMQAAAR